MEIVKSCELWHRSQRFRNNPLRDGCLAAHCQGEDEVAQEFWVLGINSRCSPKVGNSLAVFAGLGKRGTSEVLEHCVFRGALCQASGAFLGGGKSALRQVTADLLDILRSHVGVV